MKEKISVSVEREIVEKLAGYVSKGSFRNKSHVVEFALNKFMEVQDE